MISIHKIEHKRDLPQLILCTNRCFKRLISIKQCKFSSVFVVHFKMADSENMLSLEMFFS